MSTTSSSQTNKPLGETLQAAAESIEKLGGHAFPPEWSLAASLMAGNAIFQLLKSLALLFARAMLIPIEIVMPRRMVGERYYANGVLAFQWATLLVGHYVFHLPGLFALAVALISMIVVSRKKRACYLRRLNGSNNWHSYSDGDPFFECDPLESYFIEKKLTYSPTKMIVEPLIFIMGGLTISLLPVVFTDIELRYWKYTAVFPIGMYFVIAGVTSVFYHYYIGETRKTALLDQQDAMILARAQNFEENFKTWNYRGVACIGKKFFE